MSNANGHIDLIVGLGNPGEKYARTRHNAGFWFVDELARRHGATLRSERKFQGETGRVTIDGHTVTLLKPDTFMNLSGQAVQAIASFYKWPPGRLLVVHDEIDLPPGTVRLKRGGGHGGNNGLRDITQKIGKDFLRLRVGVGRPGSGEVIDHVLGRPRAEDQVLIERALDEGHDVLPALLNDGLEKAMHRLHSKPGEPSVRKNKRVTKSGEAGRTQVDAASAGAATKGDGSARNDEPAMAGAEASKSRSPSGNSKPGQTQSEADQPGGASDKIESRSLRDQLADWFGGKS